MSINKMSRRNALAQTGVLAGAALLSKKGRAAQVSNDTSKKFAAHPFRYCLNTATIRGQKIGIVKEIEVTAKAGYDSIEPWIGTIEEYVKSGGSLKELKQRFIDSGLTVESAIGFSEWIAEDEAKRAQGLERAKRDMELVAQIGGKRLAAPPAGATNLPKLDLLDAADRYRRLLEAGDRIGVFPELELWGFSKNLNRLGECVCVAIETAHPKACVLGDVYHIYKGGSDFRGIHLLGPNAIPVLHMNDYPNDPPREKIDDSYRVYPGDGIGPIKDILRLLHQTGGQTVLSLEVFNRKYWTEDPLEVAKTGLGKMKALTQAL
jgi:sugar phosphate isomerase/epimerase